MANGTIAFDTLSTSGQITGTAKSLDTDYVVNGSAKSWNNVASNQSTINNSFNISSISDAGVGLCTHTFTNAFSANPFSNAGQSIQQYDNTGLDRFVSVGTTGIRTDVRNTSNSNRDDAFSMTLHGDLA
jgi:hypothetical protein